MSEIYYTGDHLEFFQTIGDDSYTCTDVEGVTTTISKSDFAHTETPFDFVAPRRTTRTFWSYASAVLFAVDNGVPFRSIRQCSGRSPRHVLPWEATVRLTRD